MYLLVFYRAIYRLHKVIVVYVRSSALNMSQTKVIWKTVYNLVSNGMGILISGLLEDYHSPCKIETNVNLYVTYPRCLDPDGWIDFRGNGVIKCSNAFKGSAIIFLIFSLSIISLIMKHFCELKSTYSFDFQIN